MKQDFLVLMRTLHHNDAGGKGVKNRGQKREEGTESDDREETRGGRTRVLTEAREEKGVGGVGERGAGKRRSEMEGENIDSEEKREKAENNSSERTERDSEG